MTDPKLRSGIRSDPETREGITSGAEADALRDAFSFWATGVTVVTVRDETGIHGLTASAFTPLSIQPPLVLVCIGNDSPALSHIVDAGRFTVNILADGQKRAANAFSDRFPVALPAFREGDDAVIEGCLANLVCVVDRDLDGGDHRIVIGRVVSVHRGGEGAPLMHYRRAYRTLD